MDRENTSFSTFSKINCVFSSTNCPAQKFPNLGQLSSTVDITKTVYSFQSLYPFCYITNKICHDINSASLYFVSIGRGCSTRAASKNHYLKVLHLQIMLIFNADSESNVTLHYVQQSDWGTLFDTTTMPSYLLYSQLFFFLLGKRFLLMASPGICNVQGASFEGSTLALPLDTLHSDWQCKAHCSKIFECVGWSFVPINNTHGVCQLFDRIHNIRKEEQVSTSGHEPCPNGSRCQCQGLSLSGKPCNVLNSVDAVAGWRNCQEIMGRFSMDGCRFFSFHGSRCELYQE